MTPMNREQFVHQLTDSGLVSADELSALELSLAPASRPTDVKSLAGVLVQSGKLTSYQAAAAAQGKAKSLVFDEYVILDKIGQGGMGVVLKAKHRRMDRLVAIKMLPPASMKSPQAVDRFYREVKAAARLSHPNVVAAYDAREYNGVHCLVMEYVEGRDLASIVKQQGPLLVRQAVECILQAARGLQYSHAKGIIHRDIKPGNLLLDREGTVKILDMGLARIEQSAAQETGAERLTQSGQIMGTCDYMAPEQAMDTHAADARADVYSLGCTLYRLLTGKTPYQADSFAKLFLAHLNDPIPSLCDARPDVPAELDSIYQRMMAKQPDDRYPSMRELVRELEAYLGSGDGGDAGEESLNNSAFSFLREVTQGASTGIRPKVSTRPSETSPGYAPETGTTDFRMHLGDVPRRRNPRRLAVTLGVCGSLAVVALGVVIAILARSGKTTTIAVPDGSRVAIGREGRVDVTLPRKDAADAELRDSAKRWGLKRREQLPAGTGRGGFNPRLAGPASQPGVAGSEDEPPPQVWPADAPPLAVAPFDATKAREHQEAWAKYLGIPREMVNSIGMKFVLIPPGEFQMGSTPEEQAWALAEGRKRHENEAFFSRMKGESSRRRVRVSRPFYLGVCEVTQGEYLRVMGNNPSDYQSPDRDVTKYPVVSVSWDDVTAFCRKLAELGTERAAGRDYRLPAESEWEYACRAGTTTRWYFGDDLAKSGEYGWFGPAPKSFPVGQKKPNSFGLHDMHGNVREHCSDLYGTSEHRILRGADYSGVIVLLSRSAARDHGPPDSRFHLIGFRVASPVVPHAKRP